MTLRITRLSSSRTVLSEVKALRSTLINELFENPSEYSNLSSTIESIFEVISTAAMFCSQIRNVARKKAIFKNSEFEFNTVAALELLKASPSLSTSEERLSFIRDMVFALCRTNKGKFMGYSHQEFSRILDQIESLVLEQSNASSFDTFENLFPKLAHRMSLTKNKASREIKRLKSNLSNLQSAVKNIQTSKDKLESEAETESSTDFTIISDSTEKHNNASVETPLKSLQIAAESALSTSSSPELLDAYQRFQLSLERAQADLEAMKLLAQSRSSQAPLVTPASEETTKDEEPIQESSSVTVQVASEDDNDVEDASQKEFVVVDMEDERISSNAEVSDVSEDDPDYREPSKISFSDISSSSSSSDSSESESTSDSNDSSDSSDDSDSDDSKNEDKIFKEDPVKAIIAIRIINGAVKTISESRAKIDPLALRVAAFDVESLKNAPKKAKSLAAVEEVRTSLRTISAPLLKQLLSLDSISEDGILANLAPTTREQVRSERKRNVKEINSLLDTCEGLKKKVDRLAAVLEPLVRAETIAENEAKSKAKAKVAEDKNNKTQIESNATSTGPLSFMELLMTALSEAQKEAKEAKEAKLAKNSPVPAPSSSIATTSTDVAAPVSSAVTATPAVPIAPVAPVAPVAPAAPAAAPAAPAAPAIPTLTATSISPSNTAVEKAKKAKKEKKDKEDALNQRKLDLFSFLTGTPISLSSSASASSSSPAASTAPVIPVAPVTPASPTSKNIAVEVSPVSPVSPTSHFANSRPRRPLSEDMYASLVPLWGSLPLEPRFERRTSPTNYTYFSSIPNLSVEKIKVEIDPTAETFTVSGVKLPTSAEWEEVLSHVSALTSLNPCLVNSREAIQEIVLRLSLGRFGAFRVTREIPQGGDIRAIEAIYRNQTLEITIPRQPKEEHFLRCPVSFVSPFTSSSPQMYTYTQRPSYPQRVSYPQRREHIPFSARPSSFGSNEYDDEDYSAFFSRPREEVRTLPSSQSIFPFSGLGTQPSFRERDSNPFSGLGGLWW